MLPVVFIITIYSLIITFYKFHSQGLVINCQELMESNVKYHLFSFFSYKSQGGLGDTNMWTITSLSSGCVISWAIVGWMKTERTEHGSAPRLRTVWITIRTQGWVLLGQMLSCWFITVKIADRDRGCLLRAKALL